jgi:hypothetical protein
VVTRATGIAYRDRRALAARVQRAHARGMARDRRKDRWTLEPPPDWGAIGAGPQVARRLDELDAGRVPPW